MNKYAVIVALAGALACQGVATATGIATLPPSVEVTDPGARGYVVRAILMCDDANYHGAADQLRRALQLPLGAHDREVAEFQLACATAHLPGGEGLALFRRFLADHPGSMLRQQALAGVADCLYDSGDWGAAYQAYTEVDTAALTSTQADAVDYRRAYCLLMRGEASTAMAIYRRLADSREYGTGARFYLGYIAYSNGEYKEARRWLAPLEGVKASPAEDAPYFLAQIDFAQGDFDAAARRARAMLNRTDLPPRYRAETRRILGESLFRTGDEASAITQLERYVGEAEAPKPSALYILGLDAYRQGHNDLAISRLTPVVNENNTLGQNAYLLIGQAYLKEGNYDAASMALERACRLDFDEDARQQAYYNYGVASMRGGRVPFGSTVTLFEDFLTRYPDSPLVGQVSDYLVAGYVTDNNYDRALATLDKVRKPTEATDKARQQVLYLSGVRRLQNGHAADAADHLRQAASMQHTDPRTAAEARLWLGEALYRTGDYAGAEKELQAYLKSGHAKGANRAMAHYDLGYARFAAKNYAGATPAFDSYLKSAPSEAPAAQRADALNRLADCQYYAHRFDQAASTYRRAVEVSPETGDYPAFQQAMMKGLQRDHMAKIDLLSAMMERYPQSPLASSAMLETGHAYEATGNHTQAIAAYTEVAQAYPSSANGRQGLLMAAITYNSLGDTPKAKEIYRTIISRYPSSDEARTAAEDLKHISAADGTIAQYTAFLASTPGAPALEEGEAARLMLDAALSAAENNRHADALARAGELVTAYPDAPEAVEALRIKAEAETALGMAPKAWETYTLMASKASTPADINTARLGLMRVGRELGNDRQVLEIATLLAESTDTETRAEAQFAKALALSNLGQPDEAATIWESLAGDPESLWGAKSATYLGSQYLAQGRLAEAERVANAVIASDTPHQYWLAKAFILLSDVRRRQGNHFEADEYLRALRENYPGTETDIISDIDSRLNASPNKTNVR